jgi:C4-dicarboxylate-specific signal transduction histidine kinase
LFKSQIQVNAHFYSPGAVHARAGEIRQIIGNLIGNAIDAVRGSEAPEITVTVQEGSDGVELSVGDNGCGVPRENLEQIFTPFFTTKKDVGTGLGLYVSRQLAEKNGGSLLVESPTIEGFAGTRFMLMLPLAAPLSPGQAGRDGKLRMSD